MTIKDISFKDIRLKMLLAFIVLCQVYYTNFRVNGVMLTTRVMQEQMFQIGATFLFALVMLENIYLALFLIWTLFLYCYFNFPIIGGDVLINVFWGCLIYQVTYKVVNHNNVWKVFNTVLWLALVNCILIFLQTINCDPLFYERSSNLANHDLTGILGLKAIMGMFFAFCIPIMASRNKIAALFLFIPIYLSQCSVAMVGGLVAYLFVMWHEMDVKKNIILLSILAVLGGGLYVKQDMKMGMFSDRMSMWKVVTKDAFIHPITGWGLDSFRNVGDFKRFLYFKDNNSNRCMKLTYNKEHKAFVPPTEFHVIVQPNGDMNLSAWDNAHNEYLMLFYEFGAFGVILFFCLCVDVVKRFFRQKELIVCMGFFISFLIACTGQFPAHLARVGYLAVVILAIYYKLTDDIRKKDIDFGILEYGT